MTEPNAEYAWHRTTDLLPPEDVVVETMSSGGQHSLLVRSGNLWFFPDRSMYVYYTPVAWKNDSPGHR